MPEPPASEPRLPAVTVVFLAFNRREELLTSLRQTLHASDYPRERLEVIVVDNASSDGTAEAVRAQFPEVGLIVRSRNVGVSGWNEGLAAATGDYVLALDDDCYLPPHGLRRAVAAAEAHGADMVSFKVVSTTDPAHVFSEKYRTGLFMFWGCAVLLRRRVVRELGGYDPEIFVWGNELEFTLRFYDRGFRHLHLPEVAAQHMKPAPEPGEWIEERGYRINARHWAYIAAKLLAPRDALEALVALLARAARDGIRTDGVALRALPDTLAGFRHGLRRRQPLRNHHISRFYRRNFETFASPWWLSRTPAELLLALPREAIRRGTDESGAALGRREAYYRERALLYSERAATLSFGPEPLAAAISSSSSTRLNG